MHNVVLDEVLWRYLILAKFVALCNDEGADMLAGLQLHDTVSINLYT